MSHQPICDCGLEKPYHKCCQLLHQGYASFSAELLMRSRYSSYVRKLTYYLYDTTHPAQQSPKLLRDIEIWIKQPIWNKLEVIKTINGSEYDKVGKVEFIAHYQLDGKQQKIHEISSFKKYDGLWKYFDGKLLS